MNIPPTSPNNILAASEPFPSSNEAVPLPPLTSLLLPDSIDRFKPFLIVDPKKYSHVNESGESITTESTDATEEKCSHAKSMKAERLLLFLQRPSADQNELSDLLWPGVPADVDPCLRMFSWQIMLGYLPTRKERRLQTLQKKRLEYLDLVKMYCGPVSPSEEQLKYLRQVRMDLPRLNSEEKLFSTPRIQQMMERSLYVFAIRHPATGYVQGINEILTPFYVVFLNAYFPDAIVDDLVVDEIDQGLLNVVEADAYWCFSKIMVAVQDHYIFGQPGIQRNIRKLKDIVKRVDVPLFDHLAKQNMDFLQFAFRWMNCFLTREFPMACVIRLWDTYIAERAEGFSSFHVYVCAAFLILWRNVLRDMDFQQMVLFMQRLPTTTWDAKEVESILAEAYVMATLYEPSPNHLT
ncbi:TBC domain containing protein [Cardiosporidium cionae]|uniref:TBC domain containing protein n=1 Tax=Cardiosporidium cionae TaxID=476202 RepID=A0ABQ7J539_9APIC|nr:TBC domain containing protein [Cardiosporidium cionae]|eukprot:KAF8819107.1 TBC domain containing protein [Cardiosporidium cionae]